MDIDLYTFAHYINKRGLSIEELENATPLERVFYTASMLIIKKEEAENQIALNNNIGNAIGKYLLNK